MCRNKCPLILVWIPWSLHMSRKGWNHPRTKVNCKAKDITSDTVLIWNYAFHCCQIGSQRQTRWRDRQRLKSRYCPRAHISSCNSRTDQFDLHGAPEVLNVTSSRDPTVSMPWLSSDFNSHPCTNWRKEVFFTCRRKEVRATEESTGGTYQWDQPGTYISRQNKCSWSGLRGSGGCESIRLFKDAEIHPSIQSRLVAKAAVFVRRREHLKGFEAEPHFLCWVLWNFRTRLAQ